MPLINRLKAISNDDMDWIHGASLKILAETGVVFHNEEALAIFKKHGAKVNGKTVYLPQKMVIPGRAGRCQARRKAFAREPT